MRPSVRLLLATMVGVAPWPAGAIDISHHPEVAPFIDEMHTRYGFSRKELTRWFVRTTLKPDIVAAMERPSEARPWHEYKRLFVTEKHVRHGKDFWHRHRSALARAQKRYGVPPEFVIAIIGVETQYGGNTGRYRTMDALTTLWLDYPRRADFFRKELEEYLVLARTLKKNPLKIEGSYAGALGIPQFMPSSYRRFGVDLDGDRKVNLFSSPADAIGSVARFLQAHGWETGGPVVDEVETSGPVPLHLEKLEIKPALPLSALARDGIFPHRPGPARAQEDLRREVTLIMLEGEGGPLARIGYHNFYVLSRYNRSTRYAMAVVELARLIRQRYEEKT